MIYEVRGFSFESSFKKIVSKYVELKSLEVHSKMIEMTRKWFENLGKTLTIVEIYQTTLGRGNKQQNIQVCTVTGILKLSAAAIAPSLTRIFNECIHKKSWPSDWKRGQWTPAFKRDNRFVDKNYRPITTLPVVDKIFEKLIAEQTELGIKPYLSDSVTAYRKGNSTETTLLTLVENWKDAADQKQIVGVLSTDMSKAFDSLYPPLLIKKMEIYGFSKNAIDMMESYFENRKNRVKIGETRSQWMKSTRGCPQGSSLGPLLWNIYQNDLCYNILNCNLSMYADDHQLYIAKETRTDVQNAINNNMVDVCKWYGDNFLHANPDKYQVLTISTAKTKIKDIEVKVDGVDIEHSTSISLLGVTIDDQLSFSEHISNACRKASQKIGVLVRLRNLIPQEAKLTLYKM